MFCISCEGQRSACRPVRMVFFSAVLVVLQLVALLHTIPAVCGGAAAATVPTTRRMMLIMAEVPNADRLVVEGHAWFDILAKTPQGYSHHLYEKLRLDFNCSFAIDNSSSSSFCSDVVSGHGVPLNLFGVAYAANADWAVLCPLDTDGDGYTNGEELGDPNCTWRSSDNLVPASASASASSSDRILSHPGLQGSVPVGLDGTGWRARTVTTCARDDDLNSSSNSSDVNSNATKETQRFLFAEPAAERLTRFSTVVVERIAGPDDHLPTVVLNMQNDSSRALACPHHAEGLSDWHDASTWGNGSSVPASGSAVVIPAGKRVLVSACSLDPRGYATITVPAGTALIFADAPIFLRVKDILVQGELLLGSGACPLHSPISITFIGEKYEVGTFSNGILVTGSGAMRLHGRRHAWTWTRLAATIVPGTSFVMLRDAVSGSWGPGDEIVVATSLWRDLSSSTSSNHQNEVRVIVAVSPDGKTLFVDRPFRFKHFASVEYQTEVGLLSRSIILRGSPSDQATNDKYGGHTMAMGPQAVLEVIGVRAQRMGQQNVLGRYPFHMHLLRHNGPNSTLEQSACVDCWYRCVSVHKTNHTRVRKNVAYNTSGHTFYLEDGGEMFNRIEYNLAVLVRVLGRPSAGEGQRGETFDEDDIAIQPADHTASGFYIPNPHNYVVGNAASGGWSGFAYPIFPYAMRLSADLGINPSTYPVLEFDGNTAHSSGYFWGDASCIYFGGLLTDNTTTNRFTYSNGRFVHPTRGSEVHNITNTRVWLCGRGYSSWGARVEMSNFEAHDIIRSAVLFGQSSMKTAVITGVTDNDPPDMRRRGRQGFGFYDTRVMTILANITFRNYWPRAGVSQYERDGAIADLAFSDVWKPWGISATRDIQLENVDTSRTISRWVRESGSSRMFNVADWDGSLLETPSCQPHIIGSEIDWWDIGDDCFYRPDWPAYVCPRKPGREVVGLDMDLGGLTQLDFYDERTDPATDMLSQEQRDRLYIGHMSQWGNYSHRQQIITRNTHIATGLSGIGWYMYLNEGIPPLIKIFPVNFPPNGVYIVLAIPYPNGTTFDVKSATTSGSLHTPYRQVATREDVMAGNGSTYAFQDGLLYLKIGDWWATYPNAYQRHGVNVYFQMYSRRDVVVNASCPNMTSAGLCAPPPVPNPPDIDGRLPPIRTCLNRAELVTPMTPAGLCPNQSDTLRPDLVAANHSSCNAYIGTSTSRCWGVSNLGYCNATCTGTCRVFNPFPPRCTYEEPCPAAQRRPAIPGGQCSALVTAAPEQLAKEECHYKACVDGRLFQVRAPPNTPCSGEADSSEGSEFRCLPTAECVNTSFYTTGTEPVVRRVSDRPHPDRRHVLEFLVEPRGFAIETIAAAFEDDGPAAMAGPRNVTVILMVASPYGASSSSSSSGTAAGLQPPGGSPVLLYRYVHTTPIRRTVHVTVVNASRRVYNATANTTSVTNLPRRTFRFLDWGRTAQLTPRVSLTARGVAVDPMDWVQSAVYYPNGAANTTVPELEDRAATRSGDDALILDCSYHNASECSSAPNPTTTSSGSTDGHPLHLALATGPPSGGGDAFVLLTLTNGVTVRRPLPCLAAAHLHQPCRQPVVTVQPPYVNCSFSLYFYSGNRYWYEFRLAEGNFSRMAAVTAPGSRRLTRVLPDRFYGSANGQMTPAVITVTLDDGRNETYLYREAGEAPNIKRPLVCLNGYGPPPPLPQQPSSLPHHQALCMAVGVCEQGAVAPPTTTATTTTTSTSTTTTTTSSSTTTASSSTAAAGLNLTTTATYASATTENATSAAASNTAAPTSTTDVSVSAVTSTSTTSNASSSDATTTAAQMTASPQTVVIGGNTTTPSTTTTTTASDQLLTLSFAASATSSVLLPLAVSFICVVFIISI